MSRSVLVGNLQPASGRVSAWLHKVPVWAIVVYCAVIGLAYSPNIVQVFGIHNDYEMLFYKSRHFFHPEAEHLLTVARPVAALFTNLTILPLQSLDDFRWVRIFSILTVWIMGTQLIVNCVFRLRTRTTDAVAIALATFLVPSFLYSILQPAAWAPHLLTIGIVFGAYTILGRSNLHATPFLLLPAQRDYRALGRQIFTYLRTRAVWQACLVYQFALFSYPPYALILAVFPVVAVLFSQAPRAYRTLIAVRDIVFLGINLVFYSLVVKLLYFPVVRLFTSLNDTPPTPDMGPIAMRLGTSYAFKFNFDLGETLARFENLLKVTGDLWFLPQTRFHILSGVVLVLAIIATNGVLLLARGRVRLRASLGSASIARLTLASWTSEGVVALLVTAICLVISSAAVLASAGGVVSYRTIAIAIAIAAIVFIYVVRGVAEAIWGVIGSPLFGKSKFADATMALSILAALAASFYASYATMKLSRNEFAYFTGIARQVIDNKSKAIFIVDPRSFTLPQDHAMIYDQQGRAVPPYEAGCFSGYCLQTGAILRIALTELGYSNPELMVLPTRGDDPVPGLTCAMLTAPVPSYPPNASEKSISIIRYFRTLQPLTCATNSLAWHDLDARPGR